MSSEVVKKRGRPKKTIQDPIETEVPEGTKKTTKRAKSTKATPKVVKAVSPTPAKSPAVKKAIAKPLGSSTSPPNVVSKSPAPPSVAPQKSTSAPTKTAVKTPVTPETSKILNQVWELSAKTVPPAASPAKNLKPTSTIAPPKPSYPTPQPNAAPSPTAPPSNPIKPSAKPPSAPLKPVPAAAKSASPPPRKPIPNLQIPIAALNSEIVSNISTRAGARPLAQNKEFAQRYKNVARKITLAIVAMPIAIVTSWVLYERLVLGEDRKLLVKPGLAMVEAPATAEGKAEGS